MRNILALLRYVLLIAAFLIAGGAAFSTGIDPEYSAIIGVAAAIAVLLIYSVLDTAATRSMIRKRYNVKLTMNEVGFMRRSLDGNGRAVITNAAHPEGLFISFTRGDFKLVQRDSKLELARQN
jgi:membrane protein implicated in regulation of membrane protease activity